MVLLSVSVAAIFCQERPQEARAYVGGLMPLQTVKMNTNAAPGYGQLQEKKVSIVMPAYNCEKFVRVAIESILNQTYTNLELLIADDASTDSTRQIIDSISDPRISLHHNDKNLGYLATVNKLLQVCTGEVITFQDADDWSDASRISVQVMYLADNKMQICGTGAYQTSMSGDVKGMTLFPENSAKIARNISLGMSVACYASLLFSREVLETIGGYRPFFTFGAEDVDWLYRIIEKYECGNVASPLYYYRFSGASITDSVNILRQVASLRFARDMARDRAAGHLDVLQRGDLDGARRAMGAHYEQLLRQPFAEEVFKFNQLIRKRAYAQAFVIIRRLLAKQGSMLQKLAVIGVCGLKLLVGIDNYRLLRHRLVGRLHGNSNAMRVE
jgi:glycosyltransferase involved in cell wall biosynthesis